MKPLEFNSLILGFQTPIFEAIESEDQKRLFGYLNAAVMSGILLMAVGVASLSWQFLNHSVEDLVLACLVGVCGFGALLTLHILMVNLGGFALESNLTEIDKWFPSSLRLIFFSFLSILLSQALLLSFFEKRLDERSQLRIDSRIAEISGVKETLLNKRKQELLWDKAIFKEERNSLVTLANNESSGSLFFKESPRKAFLIGASNYPGAGNELPNVARDVSAIKNKLQEMGYAVLVSLDEPRDTVIRRLEDYGRELQARDISLILFSGHGFELDGHNYFIPIDFGDLSDNPTVQRDQLRKRGLMITPYLESLSPANLRMHLLVVDTCRATIGGVKPRGLALMQPAASKNVAVAMSASPGQLALDGPERGNSPYAAALLNNLSKDIDIFQLFRRVADEVVTVTAEEKRKQNLPPQTPTYSELGFTDTELRLLPPGLKTVKSLKDDVRIKQIAPQCQEVDLTNELQRKSYSMCISSVIARLDHEIEYIEGKLGAGKNSEVEDIKARKLILSAHDLEERLSMLWEDYVVLTTLTILLVMLMIGGLTVRDVLVPHPLRSYETVRYKQFRNILQHIHFSYQDESESTLSHYRNDNSPHFKHWSDEIGFYASSRKRQPLPPGADTELSLTAKREMFEWLNSMPSSVKTT